MSVPAWRWRAMGAAACGIGAAIAFRSGIRDVSGAVWIPIVALVIAGIVSQLRSLGAQLMARAFWWSNLFLGLLLSILGGEHERAASVWMIAGTGAALLLADRRALTEAVNPRDARPAAFAGTIELVMILALADAETLVLFGALSMHSGRSSGDTLLFLGAAAALLVGFFGLYRLALWGVIVTMGTALVLALTLALRIVEVDSDIIAPLIALAVIQIVVPMPMLVSIALKRELWAPKPRLRSLLASVAVAGVMIVGISCALMR